VDADHDGDLDIFLGGFSNGSNARSARNRLWRNNGDGTFADISAAAKIDASNRAVAVVPTDYDNRRDVDLLVLDKGDKPKLFRNLRDTTFRDVAAEVGLNQTAIGRAPRRAITTKTHLPISFSVKHGGIGVFAVSDGRGKFVMRNAPAGTENAAAAQFLDYDNDGLLDLIANTDKGFVVARNTGDEWRAADSSQFKIKVAAGNAIAGSRQILSGDVDRDGDTDLLAFGAAAS
jgi:hypothetical protein